MLPASASLVATDLNEEMVAYARASVPAARIAWLVADALALPFADESFDAVVYQFGIMSRPSPRVASVKPTECSRRVECCSPTPGALDQNPAHQAMQDELAGMIPDSPPRFLDTPYGYHDHERIRGTPPPPAS
jgi:SAM-dependent methyltransferase